VNSTVIDFAGLAYVSVLFIGILLYFKRIEEARWNLIAGSVILGVLVGFVFPVILKL
jgi:hypothetical protein